MSIPQPAARCTAGAEIQPFSLGIRANITSQRDMRFRIILRAVASVPLRSGLCKLLVLDKWLPVDGSHLSTEGCKTFLIGGEGST